MAQGISPNPLNDISKAYLELVAKINKEEEDKIVQNWDTTSVNKVDPDLVLSVEEEVTRKPKREELKVTTHETFSSWRDDLREIVSEPESEAEKEVKEKKVKNKVIINPKLGEAIEEIGGTILEVSEVEEPKEKEDAQLKSKANRQKMLKKQVLLRKLQAVRQGAGEDIVAGYEPDIEGVIQYFYEEGINEEGFDQLIKEIGLDEFVDFVEGGVVELNEARSARKASVRAKSYEKVKAEVDKADAARKASKKGEYASAYAKKETDVTDYGDDKPAAKKKAPAKKAVAVKKAAPKPVAKKVTPKPVAKKPAPKPVAVKKPVTKKVVKAVAKVKKTQPVKKATKAGLGARIKSAYQAGKKRHSAAVGKAKTEVGKVVKTAKTTAKQHSKHRKDFVKGISPTSKEKKIAKGVGGAVKKALTREELELLEKVKGQDTEMRKAASAERRSGETKKLSPSKGRANVAKMARDIRFYDKKTKETKPSVLGMTTREEVVLEKDLNAAERRALPDKEFALPGKGKGPEGKQAGSYPIPDKTHARMALAMVAKHGTPEKKAKVRSAVEKKFPGIKVSEAKVDTGSAEAKASARNKRNTPAGKASKFDTSVFITRKPGESLDSARTRKRRDAHAAKRGVSEEKKKGLDGKACWKGYRLAGTKKKGGKTVDNCVKEDRDKAFDNVVAALRKKHGRDAVITKDNPPKPPTEAQKKAYAAHKAKIAAQDTRDPLEKSSQGRYSLKYSNRGSD